MVGKTIATQPTAVILLRALLAKNGIAEDQVEVVKMGSDMNQLMTGQAAAVTGWLTNTNALKVIGEGRVDMMLWDAGIQLYANVYYTTDEMLANHSDVLTRFLTGSARGWGEARNNPEAGVDHLVAEYRNLSRESELEAVGGVLGFSFDDVTAKDGWAAMNPANWQAQIDSYADSEAVPGRDADRRRRHDRRYTGRHGIRADADWMTQATAVAPEARATSGATAISARGLAVRFDGDAGSVTALEHVAFEVPEAGFVTMLGPSGCGKSTLLRAIADLVPITEGAISVFGRSPEQARRARDFAFVFQDATLLPWRCAIDNVRLPLEVGRTGGAVEQHAEPEELLALVGLEGREDALPHELSGGMRQRVSIARALVYRPRVLLMDEPFGALDEITRDKLNEELLRIWRETGTTIMFVTHSVPEAAFLGQKCLVLSAHPGRVREYVDIDFPAPRVLGMRDTLEFVQVTAHLRSLLEEA